MNKYVWVSRYLQTMSIKTASDSMWQALTYTFNSDGMAVYSDITYAILSGSQE